MLFNSYAFLFCFLPVALLGYQIAAHGHRRAVVGWLALASLAFYGYWNLSYLLLLCGSILFNFLAASLISKRIGTRVSPRIILWLAIGVNLGVLCYYKYLFPSLNYLAAMAHHPVRWAGVILPLGISFFTFTQIAFLVDLEQGAAQQQDFPSYVLFVTFFPHLIAGPILHHAEMMPQFQRERDFRLRADDMAVGASWFILGLGKKVLIADKFAPDADRLFSSTAALHAAPSWAGVLAYSLQLYFDFSGYSDMANGLARMFSIRFPLNFSSPYKASSIIDFWQRWHMTLTRYINAYLYNPLSMGMNRRRVRQGKKVSKKAMATPAGFVSLVALPTTVALFLAGVWHGAGKQFIVFGLLHAFYLCVNHGFRARRAVDAKFLAVPAIDPRIRMVGCIALTYLAVVVAQVFFRADGVKAALSVLAGMAGLHGAPETAAFLHPGFGFWARIALGFAIVWAFPNTQQILAKFVPDFEQTASDAKGSAIYFNWFPTPVWGALLGLVLVATLATMQDPTTFLYFQF